MHSANPPRKKQTKKTPLKVISRPFDLAADAVASGIVSARILMKRIRCEIHDDVSAVMDRDPAATSRLEVLLLYSGVHAILFHRVAHELYKRDLHFEARAVSQMGRFCTGIEIHPGATIGRRLVIDHGTGVVIGETAEIGDNCTIYQGVTLGGTGKDVGKRHPTLGNCVLVGAGAKVLGPVTVGDNAKIAAGAVVLHEIPSNSTAVGIPAKVVRRNGERVEDNSDLDQINIPDPVAQELARLEARIVELEAKKTRRSPAKKKDPDEENA